MHMLARLSLLAAFPLLLSNPVFQILDAVAADAKLDEVEGHDTLAVPIRRRV